MLHLQGRAFPSCLSVRAEAAAAGELEPTRQLRAFFEQLARLGNAERQQRRLLQVQYDAMGFVLAKWPSTLNGAGNGVRVLDGSVTRGQVVALYPGTVYDPATPLLMQSVRNKFILKRDDGSFIDGCDRRWSISRGIYRSLARRDASIFFGGRAQACDDTWLNFYHHCGRDAARADRPSLDDVLAAHDKYPVRNPLAIGHYVNDGSPGTHGSALQYLRNKRLRYVASLLGVGSSSRPSGDAAQAPATPPVPPCAANVTYLEFEFREADFPAEQWQFIPNVHYSLPMVADSDGLGGGEQEEPPRGRIVKTQLLVATRDISRGEEILSSYLSSGMSAVS